MKSHSSAAESWLRPLLDTMLGGGPEGSGRGGVLDKGYGVVQGVWLRAGLGVGRDWGTGGLYGVGQEGRDEGRVGRDWGWVGVRVAWRTGWGWGMRAGIGVCTGVLGEWVG